MTDQYVHEENITIPQGTDFVDVITISVKNGDAMNLSDFSSLSSMIRDSHIITSGITFGISINHATNGILDLSLGSSATADIRSGWKVYDIIGVTTSGLYKRIAQGKVHITPGVTYG